MPANAVSLWQPGQSGNPLGRAKEVQERAKEKRFTDALNRDLAKLNGKTKIKRLDAVAKKLVDMALDGDIQAHKMIADRIEGAVPFLQGPTGYGPNGAGLASDGSPLVLVVKWGSPAAAPVDDIPMLELKAVGSTVASTAASEPKPSDTKDLATP